jgi:transposase
LDDRQRARLQLVLPNKPRGVPRIDDRQVISGIVHVLQSGCRWKDAPALYGPPKTLYNRNVRWAPRLSGVARAWVVCSAAATSWQGIAIGALSSKRGPCGLAANGCRVRKI